MTKLRLAGAILASATILCANGGVTFTDVAPTTGVSYARVASARIAEYGNFLSGGPFTFPEVATIPMRSHGTPGVCLFDYDGDGDDDIYVTNGPGAANSLYSNQLVETGSLGFVDVAAAAGVELTALDSTGCVAGDTDNDGDRDLYVLNMGNADNTFFVNNGGGTFTESAASGLGGGARWASVASMGDVNNDGLLDIFVGNAFDMTRSLAIYLEPVALNQHNQLFLNQGGNTFADVSQAAGMESLGGMLIETPGGVVPIPGNPAGITWAVVAYDIDLDGDIDVIFGDDQGGYPDLGAPPQASGAPRANRGLMHVYLNDGTGVFSESYTGRVGSWMGVTAGDYDHDGNLDFFASNFGDESISFTINTPFLGFQPSRWFLGDGAGSFTDPSIPGNPLPGLISTPFGWGAVSLDYDNDADTDIAYVGGLFAGLPNVYDNPLAILQNDGAGGFSADLAALSPLDQDRHRLALEHGMAVGDLNQDGFTDMVTVAATEAPPTTNPPTLFPNPFAGAFGGPWGNDALIGTAFVPNAVEPDKFDFVPEMLSFPDGKLSIEINSADNGNNWAAVKVIGTIGITSGGSVNRDGVGATVSFTPRGGVAATRPVLAGASYASQDSLTSNFGLGEAARGTVDVQWPGGVRNRLYRVRHGQTVTMPEIPCSIDTDDRFAPYLRCVLGSLAELKHAHVITPRQAARLLASAIRGYREEH